MTKNYIINNSQILLYKVPKDGGAKAPPAPPILPNLRKHVWEVSIKIIQGLKSNYYQSETFCTIVFKNGRTADAVDRNMKSLKNEFQ